MARIAFNDVMERITGKLAGSVFQDSYFGDQIRTRVSPRNPQTNFQQLRRGEFGFISATWRFLSTPEKNSFIAEAGTTPAAKNLFVGSNVNLSLINEPIITTYIPSAVPVLFPIILNEFVAPLLTIQADSILTIVPAGHKLLVFATFEKVPPKNFTNPSMYSPIIDLDEGTDLSSPFDVGAYWINRFGQFKDFQRVCIKVALINKINGSRGDESFSCAISPFVATDSIVDDSGNILIDYDATIITYP